MLASVVLRGLSKDDKVLVHNPSREFASIIAEQATLGVQITFITTNADALEIEDPSWLTIHPATPKRDIARLVRPGYSVFVDMTYLTNVESIVDRIASTFTAYCRKDNLRSLFGKVAWDMTELHAEEVRNRFTKVVAWASTVVTESSRPAWGHIPIVPINAIPEDRDRLAPLVVVEWSASTEVSVKVQPARRTPACVGIMATDESLGPRL